MWELMLTGTYSPQKILGIATHEWGLRTKQRKRIGGNPLTLSAVYRILTSPFYAGILEYDGRNYPGKHVPMVTLEEFERVQALLGRPGRPRPQRHEFAFTGMIRCGECGLSVTASQHRNRHGSLYAYYHCTKKRLDYRCRQPHVAVGELEGRILEFLLTVTIPEKFHQWAMRWLTTLAVARNEEHKVQNRSLEQARASVERQLDNLTKLRVRDMLTDDQYLKQRRELDLERMKLDQNLAHGRRESWFEPAREVVFFNQGLASRFQTGNSQQKRLILEIVGLNPTLTAGKLNIGVKKPFRRWTGTEKLPDMWSTVQDVRTLYLANDPTFMETLAKIRQVMEPAQPPNQSFPA